MKADLVELTAARRLLFDGALGTMLQEAGLAPETAPELWNVTAPDRVRAVHEAYLTAGADLIETNTFGASPAKLALYGLADRVEELNRAGVELARSAAGEQAFVVGAMGPAGRMLAPFGDLDPGEALRGFRRQAMALAAAGAAAINIETMSDLAELRLAILAALDTGLPVMAGVVFSPNERTLHGSPPEVVGAFCAGFPLLAAGTNCGLTPQAMAPLLPRLRVTWPGPPIVQPNAGSPGNYLTPAEFVSGAVALAASGARLVGGCCGTTPAHIALLHRRLQELSGDVEHQAVVVRPYLASRTRVHLMETPPTAPQIVLRDEGRHLLDAAAAFRNAETITIDLTEFKGDRTALGQSLAATWPGVAEPVVFVVDDEEILTAAVCSYPGRPGVTGHSGLAGVARRLGAFWF